MILSKIFIHGLKMVEKNKQSYLFLSVTIVISFSFLLGFLTYSDTNIYNSHKEIFAVPKELVIIHNQNAGKMQLLKKKAQMMENTFCYSYYTQQNYDYTLGEVAYEVAFVPSNMQTFYFDEQSKVTIKNGRDISLRENEAIVCESIYPYLKKNKDRIAYIDLPLQQMDGKVVYKRYFVKNYYTKTKEDTLSVDKNGVVTGNTTVLVSKDSVKEKQLQEVNTGAMVYTENIEEMLSYLQTIGMTYDAPYEAQEYARSEIKENIYIEMLIVIVLYVLLGINLFSSFVNVLNKRKYEIGIRRAIGARKRHIIMQFFSESMCIMTITIAITVSVICWLSLIYKIIMQQLYKTDIILYLSKFSVGVFLITTIILSVYFSFVFALQSTRVEIVRYLKKE